MKVVVHEGETIEQALKRFRHECMKAELVKEIKKRKYYKKPSEEKQEQRQKFLRNLRKKRRS